MSHSNQRISAVASSALLGLSDAVLLSASLLPGSFASVCRVLPVLRTVLLSASHSMIHIDTISNSIPNPIPIPFTFIISMNLGTCLRRAALLLTAQLAPLHTHFFGRQSSTSACFAKIRHHLLSTPNLLINATLTEQ